MEKMWQLRERDPAVEETLVRELGVSRVMAALLSNRDLRSPKSARAWLSPRLQDLEDPLVLRDMERASTRLAKAIRDREQILVYGDYDVDGMVGTVVLLNFIALAGGRARFHIPNRLKDGYSFNQASLREMLQHASPPRVVITVDHGTSAVEAIQMLKEEGVDVLVTDHHEPPEELPEAAYALVNPRQLDCPSREKEACGAAMAFKLAWATAQKLSGRTRVSPAFKEFLVEAMALVALATVSDVVPLKGANRILCFHGLKALSASHNPGLNALLRTSRLSGKAITATHCGFQLGPRLNAAGRMGIADTVIELLTTKEPGEAERLAARLEEANSRRRSLDRNLLEEVLALPEVKQARSDQGLCLGGQGWHVGVIGIVAARLVDLLGVPVMLVGFSGELGRGSARSIPGVHLRDVLEGCAEHLLSFGGHAGAAGCSVMQEAFPALQEAFKQESARAMRDHPHTPCLELDLELPFKALRGNLMEDLERLEPFGRGNPVPVFSTRGVALAGGPRLMGQQGSHLSFHARHQNRTLRAIYFGGGALAPGLRQPYLRLDLAYHLKRDTFRGTQDLELEIKDLKILHD